jgi:hypothetical protein
MKKLIFLFSFFVFLSADFTYYITIKGILYKVTGNSYCSSIDETDCLKLNTSTYPYKTLGREYYTSKKIDYNCVNDFVIKNAGIYNVDGWLDHEPIDLLEPNYFSYCRPKSGYQYMSDIKGWVKKPDNSDDNSPDIICPDGTHFSNTQEKCMSDCPTQPAMEKMACFLTFNSIRELILPRRGISFKLL